MHYKDALNLFSALHGLKDVRRIAYRLRPSQQRKRLEDQESLVQILDCAKFFSSVDYCHCNRIHSSRTMNIFALIESTHWLKKRFFSIYWLTHYQMTNFRLFQTERVCSQQFQIWWKWQKVIQTGRKHYGKWRNCSLRAISPFPTVFSKGLFPRGVKRCHCVGMG